MNEARPVAIYPTSEPKWYGRAVDDWRPISPNENERIARRERLVSRLVIAAIVVIFIAVCAFAVAQAGTGDDGRPDLGEPTCQVSVCP